MDKLSLTFLTKALTRLEKYLPDDTDTLLSWYDTHSDYYSVLPIGKYVYCLFALPVMSSNGKEIKHVSEIDSNVLERITILVYEGNTIIADISGLHASMDTLLTNEKVTSVQMNLIGLILNIIVFVVITSLTLLIHQTKKAPPY